MLGKKVYAKIIKYYGDLKKQGVAGEVEICVKANKENLTAFGVNSKELGTLDWADEIKFTFDIDKGKIYEMGVFGNKDKKAKAVFEVSIGRKMRIKEGLISTDPEKSEQIGLVLFLRIKSTSSKFYDFFPKKIDHQIFIKINDSQIDALAPEPEEGDD